LLFCRRAWVCGEFHAGLAALNPPGFQPFSAERPPPPARGGAGGGRRRSAVNLQTELQTEARLPRSRRCPLPPTPCRGKKSGGLLAPLTVTGGTGACARGGPAAEGELPRSVGREHCTPHIAPPARPYMLFQTRTLRSIPWPMALPAPATAHRSI
jgi:hypothetical protein